MSYAIYNKDITLQELDHIKEQLKMLYEESEYQEIRINNAIKEIERVKEINKKTISDLSEKATTEKGIFRAENVTLTILLNILKGSDKE